MRLNITTKGLSRYVGQPVVYRGISGILGINGTTPFFDGPDGIENIFPENELRIGGKEYTFVESKAKEACLV